MDKGYQTDSSQKKKYILLLMCRRMLDLFHYKGKINKNYTNFSSIRSNANV